MQPMFLPEVEQREPQGAYAHPITTMRAAGAPVPQIMHLFAYKPDRTDHLSRFTKARRRCTTRSPSARSATSTTSGSTRPA